jgi:hypothetical protein
VLQALAALLLLLAQLRAQEWPPALLLAPAQLLVGRLLLKTL